MSGTNSNFCCGDGNDHENKFVIMVDDTKECRKPSCGPVQGIPIHQVFIDLSDCKKKDCK